MDGKVALPNAIRTHATEILSINPEVRKMQTYKEEFIEFMLESNVLTFGDFTTKSGRKTPYFINTGRYRTGVQIRKLSEFYTSSIREHLGENFDVLFGPAYKGIPLAAATAMTFYQHTRQDKGYCFNRKEVKDHGEGGALVGYPLQDGDRVLIIEDVVTAGTSVRETVPILQSAATVQLVGLIVSVDRRERGIGRKTALAELREEFQMTAFAIVTIDEIIQYLKGRKIGGMEILNQKLYDKVQRYREEYGGED